MTNHYNTPDFLSIVTSIKTIRIVFTSVVILGCIFLMAVVTSGCGSHETTIEITEQREITQPATPPVALSESERFGFDVTPSTAPTQAGSMSHVDENAPHYHWTTPTGWSELPPTPLRLVNLLVAGNEVAECYFTVLPGGGGGITANINRWRAQMGLPPMEESDIDDLPKASLLDLEAVYIELDGTFSGMRGELTEPDFRMVGLIAEDAANAYFIKMTGPQELILSEMGQFQVFVDSLHTHHGQHSPVESTVSPQMQSGVEASLPAGHPPISAEPSENDLSQIKWIAPEHWTRGADRVMRLVTYTIGDSQCYVTVLAGSGGGVEANINRWRSQMAQEPLSEIEIADLPSFSMLDQEAIYVEIEGDYTGMTGPTQPEAMLLGAILLLEDSSLFILMVGPKQEIQDEVEHFKAYCQSFHW